MARNINRETWYSPVEIHTAFEKIMDRPVSEDSGSDAVDLKVLPEDKMPTEWGCFINHDNHRYQFSSDHVRTTITYQNKLGSFVIFCQNDGRTYSFNTDRSYIQYSARTTF